MLLCVLVCSLSLVVAALAASLTYLRARRCNGKQKAQEQPQIELSNVGAPVSNHYSEPNSGWTQQQGDPPAFWSLPYLNRTLLRICQEASKGNSAMLEHPAVCDGKSAALF
ncbi:hypothetical protein BCR44DRAFT_1104928 [Catenaria anguillulae PL171]|uniref:Uncharacterized protein n=1 Tax=Catenaria anguillulae PL171 TaxID=765915 RepID=A0A1Y2I2H5_9FUNG|nr:hypothetical protein BCR44DRAFT_1104928 [Catenaria anguillulae PL171]